MSKSKNNKIDKKIQKQQKQQEQYIDDSIRAINENQENISKNIVRGNVSRWETQEPSKSIQQNKTISIDKIEFNQNIVGELSPGEKDKFIRQNNEYLGIAKSIDNSIKKIAKNTKSKKDQNTEIKNRKKVFKTGKPGRPALLKKVKKQKIEKASFFDNIYNAIKNNIGTALAGVMGLIFGNKIVSSLLKGMSFAAKSAKSAIKFAPKLLWNSIKFMAKSVGGALKLFIYTPHKWLVKTIIGIPGAIGSVFKTITSLPSIAAKSFGKFINLFKTMGTKILGLFTVDAWKKGAKAIKEGTKKVFVGKDGNGGLLKGIKGLLKGGGVGSWVMKAGVVGLVVAGIVEVGIATGLLPEDTWKQVWDFAKFLGGKAWEKVKEFGNWVSTTDTFKAVMEFYENIDFVSIVKNMKNYGVQLWRGLLTDPLPTIGQLIKDGFTTLFNGLSREGNFLAILGREVGMYIGDKFLTWSSEMSWKTGNPTYFVLNYLGKKLTGRNISLSEYKDKVKSKQSEIKGIYDRHYEIYKDSIKIDPKIKAAAEADYNKELKIFQNDMKSALKIKNIKKRNEKIAEIVAIKNAAYAKYQKILKAAGGAVSKKEWIKSLTESQKDKLGIKKIEKEIKDWDKKLKKDKKESKESFKLKQAASKKALIGTPKAVKKVIADTIDNLGKYSDALYGKIISGNFTQNDIDNFNLSVQQYNKISSMPWNVPAEYSVAVTKLKNESKKLSKETRQKIKDFRKNISESVENIKKSDIIEHVKKHNKKRMGQIAEISKDLGIKLNKTEMGKKAFSAYNTIKSSVKSANTSGIFNAMSGIIGGFGINDLMSSKLSGGTKDFYKVIASLESGGNDLNAKFYARNPSGAFGFFQFMPKTWNEQSKQIGINWPMTKTSKIPPPNLQIKVYNEVYLKNSIRNIQNAGLEVNVWNLWLAHNLGGGSLKFMNGITNTPHNGALRAINNQLPNNLKSNNVLTARSNYVKFYQAKIAKIINQPSPTDLSSISSNDTSGKSETGKNTFSFNNIASSITAGISNGVYKTKNAINNYSNNTSVDSKAGLTSPVNNENTPKIEGTFKTRGSVNMTGVKPQALKALKELSGEWTQKGNGNIIVRSAYRSPSHNAAVGGAKNSMHIKGIAFDIAVESWPIDKRKEFIVMAGRHGFKGFGVGENTIHIDMRTSPASWGYKNGAWVHGAPSWATQAIAMAQNAAGSNGLMSIDSTAINAPGGETFNTGVNTVSGGGVTMQTLTDQLSDMKNQIMGLHDGINTLAKENLNKNKNHLVGDIDLKSCGLPS